MEPRVCHDNDITSIFLIKLVVWLDGPKLCRGVIFVTMGACVRPCARSIRVMVYTLLGAFILGTETHQIIPVTGVKALVHQTNFEQNYDCCWWL